MKFYRSKNRNALIVSIAILMVSVVGCTPKTTDTSVLSSPTPRATQISQAPASSPTPLLPSPRGEYSSSKLKVKFNVNPDGPEYTYIKEEGSKIYVVPGDYPKSDYKKGQWLEVFSKDRQDAMPQALEKQFLKNIDPKDCFIKKIGHMTPLGNNVPANYEYYAIDYPHSDDYNYWNNNKCPPEYRVTNGIRYFVYDPKHPLLYAFLDIGQYPITSAESPQVVWQNTLQFID